MMTPAELEQARYQADTSNWPDHVELPYEIQLSRGTLTYPAFSLRLPDGTVMRVTARTRKGESFKLLHGFRVNEPDVPITIDLDSFTLDEFSRVCVLDGPQPLMKGNHDDR